MANRLGRVIRYFSEAIQYGRQPLLSVKTNRKSPILEAIFDANAYTGATAGDEDRYMRLGVTSASVYHAIDVIAKRVASVKNFSVQSTTNGGETWEDDPSHEFTQILKKPNSLMSGTLLLSEVSWWFKLSGNAYIFLDTPLPGQGPIRGMYPLPSDAVEVDPTSVRVSSITGEPVVDYIYTLGGAMETIPGENIIHFRTANPFDFWTGLSPLTALQSTLDTAYAQATWLASYFDEGNAIPTAVISVPSDLSDPDFDEVRDSIIRQFGAQRRAAITRAGELSVQTIQHTIDDMRVMESLTYHDGEIDKVYGVPPGLTSASSGQARLAAETALARDVVQPMIDYLAEVLTVNLTMYYDDFRVNGANVVPQDRAMEVKEYQIYGADMTINEGRKEKGLDSLSFSGDMVRFQPLLDQVPVRLLKDFAPAILSSAGGGPNQSGLAQGDTAGSATAPSADDIIVAEMTGQMDEKTALIAEMTPGNGAAGNDSIVQELTGNAGGDGNVQEIGPATNGGLQTEQQMMDALTGDGPEDAMPEVAKGIVLSADEMNAVSYAAQVAKQDRLLALALGRAEGAPAGLRKVVKAFNEADHPRDDNGRFVDKVVGGESVLPGFDEDNERRRIRVLAEEVYADLGIDKSGEYTVDDIAEMFYEWAVENNSPGGIAMQIAAHYEFGAKLSAKTRDLIIRQGILMDESIWQTDMDIVRFLKEYSPRREMTLYRGVGDFTAEANALESWTTDRDIAKFYADRNGGGVVEKVFPPSQILATWKDGIGLESAKEVIVINN